MARSGEHVIRLIATHTGGRTELDGQLLKEYDPPQLLRSGKFAGGRILGTSDPGEALGFPDALAALECYRKANGVRYYDGKPNRPLTAWHIEIYRLP